MEKSSGPASTRVSRAFDASSAHGPLLLVGKSGERARAVRKLAAASQRRDSIEIHDRVEDTRLEELYATAAAFVLPSLYEGFGFPPLEAMSRGCPVLASDIPALRETLDDAALFLPPEREEAWARALERVEQDAALSEDLRARGFANVRRFSWLETAHGVTDMIRRLTPPST